MPRRKARASSEAILEVLQDILIFHLASAGVTQPDIRKLLSIDIVRVNKVARLLKRTRPSDNLGSAAYSKIKVEG